ncbi:MAG TPA: hypothetical protein VLM40_01965, partial [Gemmata sp.]|nr:hypothetical protein [Gemmata sp.]
MIRSFPFLLAVAGVMALGGATARAEDQPQWKWYEVKDGKVLIHLHVFWSRTCPHCASANSFLVGLQQRHDWLKVFHYEVSSNPANMDLYRRMAESIGRQAGSVPAFFYGKQLAIGYASDETTGKRLEEVLLYYQRALQKQVDDRRRKAPAAVLPLLFLPLLHPQAQSPEPEPDLEIPPPPPEQPTVDVPW